MEEIVDTARTEKHLFSQLARPRLISSFSERTLSDCIWSSPDTIENLTKYVSFAKHSDKLILARGGWHTCGDMILNSNGFIADSSHSSKILNWDRRTGQLTCSVGD